MRRSRPEQLAGSSRELTEQSTLEHGRLRQHSVLPYGMKARRGRLRTRDLYAALVSVIVTSCVRPASRNGRGVEVSEAFVHPRWTMVL